MPLFTGNKLTCTRGQTIVFHELSFRIESGGMLLLVGPNGSGKSSLLRIMAGLLEPTLGEIKWRSDDALEDQENHARRLHYVGHHDAVKPALNVWENLHFWAAIHGDTKDIETRISSALENFDIIDLAQLRVQYLSAGQRRRTSLSRILTYPAPIWLLDEPMAALDESAISLLKNLIANHRSAGGIVIMSTHNPILESDIEILDLCDFQMPPLTLDQEG